MEKILTVYRKLGIETEEKRAALRKYAHTPLVEPEAKYATSLFGSCYCP